MTLWRVLPHASLWHDAFDGGSPTLFIPGLQSQNSDTRAMAIVAMKWVCYPTGDDPNLWGAWFAKQNPKVRARHAVVMRYISAGHWDHYKPLTGKRYAGLGEIVVKTDVQWRLIGHRGNGKFTLVMVCSHKGTVYSPKDALETAVSRWKEMQEGCEGIELDVYPN